MLTSLSPNLTKFNSATSSKFLDDYETYLKDESINSHKSIPSKTFAPSSMRCNRLSWFRLRGTKPDIDYKYDAIKDFSADCGTALHKMVQSNLKSLYKDNWKDVDEYLKKVYSPDEYSINIPESSLEVQVSIPKYHIKFACDGIINLDNKDYLFELKTVTYDKFKNIVDILPEHKYQVYTYCTMLHLDKCIILYLDRMYGDIKAFEVDIPQYIQDKILDDMKIVLHCVETNIAPGRLPTGSTECNYCKYAKTCKEY